MIVMMIFFIIGIGIILTFIGTLMVNPDALTVAADGTHNMGLIEQIIYTMKSVFVAPG